MSNISQIAYSGINAAQIGLTTTGQNIANIHTPGYSRLNTTTESLSGISSLNAGRRG